VTDPIADLLLLVLLLGAVAILLIADLTHESRKDK
jgi:hypothetical protein